MSGRWTSFQSGVAASLLALGLWGCDAGSAAESKTLLGPSLEAAYNQGSPSSFQRVKERDGAGTISATIGLNGGMLTLGHHELFVPRGAVDAPTLFQMSTDEVDGIEVDLTATRTLADGTVLNVGEQGFATPVTLKLSYRGISEDVDISRLIIVWVRPDGTFEPQPSKINPSGRRVEAFLDHFSRYAVAIN